jgi:hypothetical protein
MRFQDYAEAQTTALRAPVTRVSEPVVGELEACVSHSTSGVKP